MLGNASIIWLRQRANAVSEPARITMIDLYCRWRKLGIVERARCDLDLIIVEILEAQWRAAFAAKTALANVGTAK